MTEQTIVVPNEAFIRDLPRLPESWRYVLWSEVADGRVDLDTVTMVIMHSSVAGHLPLLARMPNLSDVQMTSIGYEYVLSMLPRGVRLHNAAGVMEASTAEHAMALLLAMERGIPRFLRDQDRHRWPDDEAGPTGLLGVSLVGKHVVLLGNGGVGREVQARLQPFGCTVDTVASRARVEDGVVIHGIDELSALLPGAAAVVLALPLTDATRGIVDAAFLERMSRGALLVNVGRGGLVDTVALERALRARRIRAALDVVDTEPLPADASLWAAPGLLITPHVGGLTDRMWPNQVRLIGDQVLRHIEHRPLVNTIRTVAQAA